MEIVVIPCLQDNYAYLLIAPASKEAAIIDPSEAPPVIDAVQQHGVKLRAILCTHHHPDHTGGNQHLLSRNPDLLVYGHASDQRKGRIFGQTVGLDEGDFLPVCGQMASIMHIPGHTKGAVAYYFAQAGVVFTGDTLFGAGCGRLFEGTPQMMHASLTRLSALPGETRVYCGHEYTEKNLVFAAAVEPDSEEIAARRERVAALRGKGQPSVPFTLDEERATNPFLRVGQPAVIKAAQERQPALPQAPSPVEVFATIRTWKDSF